MTAGTGRSAAIPEGKPATNVSTRIGSVVLDVWVAPVAGAGTCLVTDSYANTLDPRALDLGGLCAASVSVSVGFRVRVGAWQPFHSRAAAPGCRCMWLDGTLAPAHS